MPCIEAAEHLTIGGLTRVLDCAGEERFLAKVAQFQATLAETDSDQALYQGVMGALGYTKNKLPFLELARRLPLRILETLVHDDISDEECLDQQQALLLGTAGLLPSQRQNRHQGEKFGGDDKWANKLERLWAASHQTKAMSTNDWHLFKVRPNNSPVRRIVAMCYLILRYRGSGLFEELTSMVRQASVNKGHHYLERGLVIAADGYWANHLDFGSWGRAETLLGVSRADDIVVNVILPFTFAWSRLAFSPELGEKALCLYRQYPKLAANTVERHMRAQLGLSSSLVNSARRQQGLLHIYNTLCTQGRCNSCPLAQV